MKAEEAREAARNGSLRLNDDLPFNVRPCGKVLFEFFEICRHSSDGYGGEDEGSGKIIWEIATTSGPARQII